MQPHIHHSAEVDASSHIGRDSRVWQLSQIREFAQIGDETTIARSVYIGPRVTIGSRTKIQNGALIYEPSIIGSGVFIGPGVVLTNDKVPRALDSEGRKKVPGDWAMVGVTIGDGASIGANATCVGPVSIGEWAMVAAGAVVIESVASFAIVAGVPARQIGWVNKAGNRLRKEGSYFRCPDTGTRFLERNGQLERQ